MERPDDILRRVRAELKAAQIQVLRALGVTESECMTQATEATDAMVQRAIDRANRRTSEILLQGQGTTMLADEKNSPKNHAAFDMRRVEGVRDSEIEQWWNLSVFEQELLMVVACLPGNVPPVMRVS